MTSESSVNVLGRMIAWGGQPFGAAIGGLIAVVTSVRVAYTVAALVMAASAIVASVLLRPWTALAEPVSKAGPHDGRSSRPRERNLNLDARSGALLRIRPRTSRRPEVGESPTRSRHCHGVGAVPSLEPDLATPPPQRDARSRRRPRIHDRHRRSAADTAPADRHPLAGVGALGHLRRRHDRCSCSTSSATSRAPRRCSVAKRCTSGCTTPATSSASPVTEPANRAP